MKKAYKNNLNISIKDLMNHITLEMYTKQTLISLFRCLLETVIETRQDSIVLTKLKDTQKFEGLLNRLKYSDLNVYSYTNDHEHENFKQIKLENIKTENDEFLIIIDEKFSACLYWDESSADIFGLCTGFCSLNPCDSRQIVEHIQSIEFDENLEKDLANIKQDRRNNENFTIMLRKLLSSLESRQRDLICANTELKELYNKTLQTEKLAAVGQLCSTIAHELRNPLGSMDLYAKIISKTVENLNAEIKNPEAIKSLTNASNCISNSLISLERLLTELIDYSKPMIIKKSDDEIEQALIDTINLLKPSFEAKGVNLIFDYTLDKETCIKFDKIKLNQAVLNVIKNALEISKKDDTVQICVDCRYDDNTAYIKVQDQGSGILIENKEKIFTPYFSTKKEGTGLGLAQARKIMEAHGGSLIIISTSPKGTTFGLTLPIEQSQS